MTDRAALRSILAKLTNHEEDCRGYLGHRDTTPTGRHGYENQLHVVLRYKKEVLAILAEPALPEVDLHAARMGRAAVSAEPPEPSLQRPKVEAGINPRRGDRLLVGAEPAPPDQEQGKSAGDLLVEAVDQWMPHATVCDLDECAECAVMINRLKLAYKVWQVSQHKGIREPAQPAARTGVEQELLAVVQSLDEYQRIYEANTWETGYMPGNKLYGGRLIEIVRAARSAIVNARGESALATAHPPGGPFIPFSDPPLAVPAAPQGKET